MTRSMSAAMIAALTAAPVKKVYFIELLAPSGTLRFNTSPRDLTWSAQTWLGGNQLQSIPDISEEGSLRASGCRLVFNPSLSSLISVALTMTQGAVATIWFGLVTSGTEALVIDPIQILKANFDYAAVADDPERPVLDFNFETSLLRMDRPGTFRYTDSVQKSLFPGDLGFQYVSKLEDWSGFWGKTIKIKSLRRKYARENA